MKVEITIELTIKVPVRIAYESTRDDDGCRHPSATGNAMTGDRGRGRDEEWYELDCTADELRKIVEAELAELEA